HPAIILPLAPCRGRNWSRRSEPVRSVDDLKDRGRLGRGLAEKPDSAQPRRRVLIDQTQMGAQVRKGSRTPEEMSDSLPTTRLEEAIRSAEPDGTDRRLIRGIKEQPRHHQAIQRLVVGRDAIQ